MTIDPSILQGIKPVEIQDPLTRYANVLAIQHAMNQNDDYQQGLRDTAAANAAYRNALNPDGTLNRTKLLTGYASGNLGAKIPTLQKSLADVDKTEAETKRVGAETGLAEANTNKANYDTIGKALEFARKGLDGVSTPEQASAWLRSQYTNPVLAAYHSAQGDSLQKDVDMLANVIKAGKFDGWLTAMKLGSEKALENVYHTIDSGGKIDYVASPKYGVPSQTVVSSTPKTYDPSHPGTKIDIHVPGQKTVDAFSSKIGEYGATNLNDARQQATNAYHRADRAARILGLLDDPNTITGAGADWELNADRVFAKLGVSGYDGKVVTTQKLAKELAANVLDNFTALKGMGVTRLTQGELEQIKNASPGKINLGKQTIRELVREDYLAAQMAVKGYNDQYQSILKSPSAASLAPSGFKPMADIPDYFPQPSADDIGTLKARAKEPGIKEYFDKTYGSGAADRVLKGVR